MGDITEVCKYELIGDLVCNPTRHGLVTALFHCAKSNGSVSLVSYGALMVDSRKFCELCGGESITSVPTDRIEIVRIGGVADFLHLLTKMVDSGGISDLWPTAVVVQIHVRDWDRIPLGENAEGVCVWVRN
ncbi:MAG: hypothetical protein AB7D39_17335 [Pseudodesulfovibrio sp.]|uniref:hypothetical protein n=1 Tax=Pseudodesulfovibrio sp. TaxID=2035812 RepID=UPI003D09CF41